MSLLKADHADHAEVRPLFHEVQSPGAKAQRRQGGFVAQMFELPTVNS